MSTLRLSALTWQEVEDYLSKKQSILIPVGSVEQHGPIGLIGTDYLCAEVVANSVGDQLGMIVAPPLSYGMSSHHLAFAGSASVRPSVYQAFVADLIRGFYFQGFRQFYFINGHGGNVASLDAVFQELKHENLSQAVFSLLNWWKMPEVQAFAHQLYGNEEGSHATPSEVSLAFYVQGIPQRDYQPIEEPPPSAWPLTAQEFKNIFKTGTVRSNPGLARAVHGEQILSVATASIVKAIGVTPQL